MMMSRDQTWWRAGGGTAACCAVLVLGLVSGCTQLGPAERESLTRAAQQYEQGDAFGAIARMDRLITDFGQAAEIGEAYYVRGLCRAKLNQSQQAEQDFKEALKRSNRHDLAIQAKVSLGTLAYRRGDWQQAADRFNDVLPSLADQPPKDELLFAAGVSHQRGGNWTKATVCFSEVLHKFKDRPVAAAARRLGSWCHQYFAIQLGAYRNTDYAQDALRAFRAKGLDPVQESLPRQGEVLWVVMVGQYRSYADAQAALVSVRKRVPGAYVIP